MIALLQNFINEDVVKPNLKILFIRNRVPLPVKLPFKKLFSIEEIQRRYSFKELKSSHLFQLLATNSFKDQNNISLMLTIFSFSLFIDHTWNLRQILPLDTFYTDHPNSS